VREFDRGEIVRVTRGGCGRPPENQNLFMSGVHWASGQVCRHRAGIGQIAVGTLVALAVAFEVLPYVAPFLPAATSSTTAATNCTSGTSTRGGMVSVEWSAAARSTATASLAPYYLPNAGFLGQAATITLPPGTRISRFGYDSGAFASPEGVPPYQRSLPYGVEAKPYSVFEIVEPLEVRAGVTAPWFGHVGGGLQYELPGSVAELIDQAILKRIGGG